MIYFATKQSSEYWKIEVDIYCYKCFNKSLNSKIIAENFLSISCGTFFKYFLN